MQRGIRRGVEERRLDMNFVAFAWAQQQAVRAQRDRIGKFVTGAMDDF
jgi:hypothetical protein